MSLEVIHGGGQKEDPLQHLAEALRELIREVVREEEAKQPAWKWLTSEQASELLGISPHRISARVREGKLPGRKYGGRTYVDRVELERQIDRSRR